jgi:signal peptide peptidase SppA
MDTDLRAWLRGHVWALDLDRLDVYAPAALEHWAAVLEARRPESQTILQALLAARGQADDVVAERRRGPLAHLPIFGFLSARPSLSSLFFGGTSLQDLRAALAEAAEAPKVESVLLEIDSPGGSVYGLHQTWAAIRDVDRRKPVHAVITGLGASAAYWLASAARSIAIAPLGEAGSIGVVGVHADRSQYWTAQGVTHTVLTAGKHKAEGIDVKPLTPEAEQAITRRIEAAYAHFVADVAAGRGVTPAAVREGFGEGRLLAAEDAVAAGLADQIGTLEDVTAAQAGRISDVARRAELAALLTA